MQRFISITLFMAFAAILSSCSQYPSTPTKVVEAYLEAMQSHEFDKVIELLYINPELSEQEAQESRDMYSNLLGEKAARTIDDAGGIASYEVLEERLKEDGTEAIVVTKVVFGNQASQKQNTRLIKANDGKWYIDLGK